MSIPYLINATGDALVLHLGNGTTIRIAQEDGNAVIRIHEEQTALSSFGEAEITHVCGTDRLANLPRLTFDELHHVGTLDITRRRQGSHEGCHLSVSTHPDAWRQIYTSDTGLKTLTKRGADFIDAHAISMQDRTDILRWAESNGLIENRVIYQLEQEDENRDLVMRYFETHEKAEAACYDEDELETIAAVDGYILTPKLVERMNLYANEVYINGFDYALMAFAEDRTDADGVFWTDTLNIFDYSAPRGALFNSKRDTFAVTTHD